MKDARRCGKWGRMLRGERGKGRNGTAAEGMTK